MSISSSSSSSSSVMGTLRIVTKVASSGVFLAGAGMTAMALGVVPIDPQMAAVADVFSGALGLPLQPFLLFVGLTKIWSVLRLWDKAPGTKSISKNVAWVGLAAPAASAVYGHYQTEGIEGTVPPTIYLCILAACHYLETKKDKEDEAKKKE